jgi:peptidoglycan/LPS O-acetylase OafA/YrhL
MVSHNKQLVSIKQDRILEIEIIRFISAISVVVWHYQHFFYINEKVDFIKDQQPFFNFFKFFYEKGYYGVQVFWLISGFILFWKYKELIVNKKLDFKNFFILRFSRLYPLHFLTLIIVALLQAIYSLNYNHYFVYGDNNIKNFLLQLFFISNWFNTNNLSYNGPIWSVSIEVLIYIFYFLFLRYVSKSNLINIFFICLYFLANFFKIKSLVLNCLLLFYIGGFFSILFKYLKNKKDKKNYYFFFIFFLLIVTFVFNDYFLEYFPIFSSFFSFNTKYYLLTVCGPAVLFYVYRQYFSMATVIKKIIIIFGNMTYSIYLIHFPIQLIISLYFRYTNQKIPYYNNIFFILYLVITLIISFYLYYFFELKMQNFIRKNFK